MAHAQQTTQFEVGKGEPALVADPSSTKATATTTTASSTGEGPVPATTTANGAASGTESPPPPTEAHARTKELLKLIPAEEQSHLVQAKSQEGVQTLPAKKDAATGKHFLVALDPGAKHGQAEKEIELVKHLAKPDDVIVLLSVLDPVFLEDPGIVPLAAPYSAPYPIYADQDRLRMLSSLKRMREHRANELSELIKTHFPNHDCYVHVVHGSPDKKILWAAEQHHADVIVIGKRKMGRFEQLFYHSVSNYVTSHAACSVIVAK